jgi:hypothetical protein
MKWVSSEEQCPAKILDAQEVKPHKVRYYLERRDPKRK